MIEFPPKKKWYYMLQIFKDGEAVTPPQKIKLRDHLAIPWEGHELIKWLHEVTIYLETYVEFDGTIPHISRYDGSDKLVEEWDLLGVKTIAIDMQEEELEHAVTLRYEDVKHSSYVNWGNLKVRRSK